MIKKLALLLAALVFFMDATYSQSLKDRLVEQDRIDSLEKMRKADEVKIKESEKSKNSVDRDTLSREGFTIECRKFIYSDETSRDFGERQKIGSINLGFSFAVILKDEIFSVFNCEMEIGSKGEDKFCARKAGAVRVNGNEIEYKQSLLSEKLTQFPDEVPEWLFDGSTSTLYAMITSHPKGIRRIACSKKKWIDKNRK